MWWAKLFNSESATLLCLALLLACQPACGDGTPPPIPARDSGPPSDAGTFDVGGGDAGEVDGGRLVVCSTEVFELARDPISRARTAGAASVGGSLTFAWADSSDSVETIRVADLAAGQARPEIRAIATDQSFPRALTVGRDLVAWVEEDFGDQPVRAAVADSAMVWDVSEAIGVHAGVRVIADEAAYWVAYGREELGLWDAQLRRFDGTEWGERITVAIGASSSQIGVALAGSGLFLAWVQDGSVYVQHLNASSGEPLADAVVVSTEANAVGEVDLVFDDNAGLVVFTVEQAGVPQVRSRLLLLDGTPLRGEQLVSTLPWQGRSPSAVAYGGGFAVGFRGRNSLGEHEVRIGFVHGSDGDVVAEYGFGGSDWDDGPVRVGVTEEGLVGIAWATVGRDGISTFTSVQAARLECAEAWLRCSAGPSDP